MPRHEIVVDRIPAEFQGKPVRLPPVTAMPHIYTRTVAEYRASQPVLQELCPSCGSVFDMSNIEAVFAAWGPDAVITVSLRCHWVPGEPRPKAGERPRFLGPPARQSRAMGGPEPNTAGK